MTELLLVAFALIGLIGVVMLAVVSLALHHATLRARCELLESRCDDLESQVLYLGCCQRQVIIQHNAFIERYFSESNDLTEADWWKRGEPPPGDHP